MIKKSGNSNGAFDEREVSQELRQIDFDNYNTTDDHATIIYGIAKDQHGRKYFMVKNSWGTTNPYRGAWYFTESYLQHKTINIMVHKDAISSDIYKKLKL